jgi:hypothetical protein
MFVFFSELGVAVAVGSLAIVVLVGIVWRRRTRRLRARPRPASPEAVDHQPTLAARIREHDRLDALRKIAASDYRKQTRHGE